MNRQEMNFQENNFKDVLGKNPLFRAVSEEYGSITNLPGSGIRTFDKGEYLFYAGDNLKYFGFVFSGSVSIESYDDKGNKQIFAVFSQGEHFGISYSISDLPVMVDARAVEKSQVLFLRAEYILKGRFLSQHPEIAQRLIKLLAQKNMTLSRKIRNISPKTIRSRVMNYLKEESMLHKSSVFFISYDRQGLADYLNCDRSQLSKTLSVMQNDGLINYSKNNFEIFF